MNPPPITDDKLARLLQLCEATSDLRPFALVERPPDTAILRSRDGITVIDMLSEQVNGEYPMDRLVVELLNDAPAILRELLALRVDAAVGLRLAGWKCSACGVFNSEEKEMRPECRGCAPGRRP